MRQVTGKRLDLKYRPFPAGDKSKTEYLIGEALLRWKGKTEEEVATLNNVRPDPPDLAFEAADYGNVGIEITEFVPFDRKSEARSANFQKKLRAELKKLQANPLRPSNIFISRGPGEIFPTMKLAEIRKISVGIDNFFKSKDFEERYERIHDIASSPIKVTFIPALGTWSYPKQWYVDNLFISDITGRDIGKEVFERTFADRIRKKGLSETATDILIMFQGTTGIVGLSEEMLNQAAESMKSKLSYQGIYIVEIIQLSETYWINVITIREHPLFEATRMESGSTSCI